MENAGTMESVPAIRFKRDLATYIDRAKAGERTLVSINGRVVAVLAPWPDGPIENHPRPVFVPDIPEDHSVESSEADPLEDQVEVLSKQEDDDEPGDKEVVQPPAEPDTDPAPQEPDPEPEPEGTEASPWKATSETGSEDDEETRGEILEKTEAFLKNNVTVVKGGSVTGERLYGDYCMTAKRHKFAPMPEDQFYKVVAWTFMESTQDQVKTEAGKLVPRFHGITR